MSVSWGCEGCGGDVAAGGDAEVDGLGAAGGGGVGLGEFLVGPCEADLESFCFVGPSFAFGFGDDEITNADGAWVAACHPAQALLHRVDPAIGITEADYPTIGQWLDGVGPGGIRPDGP
jgi:hypothetical protein